MEWNLPNRSESTFRTAVVCRFTGALAAPRGEGGAASLVHHAPAVAATAAESGGFDCFWADAWSPAGTGVGQSPRCTGLPTSARG